MIRSSEFSLALILFLLWKSTRVAAIEKYPEIPMVWKDGSLADLSKLFNHGNKIFTNWIGADVDFENLMVLLSPWIIADLPVKMMQKNTLAPVPIDCSNKKYRGVFTGVKLPTPRIIVDFIPFGYDIDKLEIRFYETFKAVDVYVIYETTRTQSGLKKPLYFSKVKDSPRFKRWAHKVIYIFANDSDINQFLSETRSGMAKDGMKANHDKWSLERAMRTEMVRRFAAISVQDSYLKRKVMLNLESALGIQNDGDEIPTGKTLLHLKLCEMKASVESLYLPAFAFKKNFHWLQSTNYGTHAGCLQGFDINSTTSVLLEYLWKGGPYIWPLKKMLTAQETLRNHFPSGQRNRKNATSVLNQVDNPACVHHMGLGAAVHLSSVAEPVEYLLKRCGVIEQTCANAISPKFVDAARRGAVTPALIFEETIHQWCSESSQVTHMQHISSPILRSIIEESIPAIVRLNPASYPFFLPGDVPAAVLNSVKLSNRTDGVGKALKRRQQKTKAGHGQQAGYYQQQEHQQQQQQLLSVSQRRKLDVQHGKARSREPLLSEADRRPTQSTGMGVGMGASSQSLASMDGQSLVGLMAICAKPEWSVSCARDDASAYRT